MDRTVMGELNKKPSDLTGDTSYSGHR